MNLLEVAAVFLSLLALLGWANALTLKLPTSVATLSAGLLAAGVLYVAQTFIGPFWGFNVVRTHVAQLDFSGAVLGYMLAFLLFAGGMQVDLGEFRKRQLPILTLATFGVLVSTGLVGGGLWLAARLLGLNLPLSWALVFGALISPTDAVAVIGQVRAGGLSKRLSAVLEGEALFNDGVGVVVFTTALAFATSGAIPDPLRTGGKIVLEAGGGLVVGWACGFVVVRALAAVDDYVVALTASLAVAVGVYSVALALHLSGPIAAVAAGMVMGGYGEGAASDQNRRQVHGFWHLVDEVLNGLLFLFLSFQVFVVPFDFREAGLWATAIALTCVARLVVVLPWGAWFRVRYGAKGSSLVLAWGGLRGAISLALALSLPKGVERNDVLTCAFAVVVFSVLVQGLTFGPLVRWLKPRDDGSVAGEP